MPPWSKKKGVYSLILYECWLVIVAFIPEVSEYKHHIWRQGSSIKPTERAPKGSEGISEAISNWDISEVFFSCNQNIMAISLPNFPPLEVHFDGNADPRWKRWLERFERATIGMGIGEGKQVDDGDDKDYKHRHAMHARVYFSVGGLIETL